MSIRQWLARRSDVEIQAYGTWSGRQCLRLVNEIGRESIGQIEPRHVSYVVKRSGHIVGHPWYRADHG